MTTATYERPLARALPGVSFGRVVKSELIKFRSLRSTWITYVVALVVGDGFGLLGAALRGSDAYSHHEPIDKVAITLHGIMFAQLALGVIGVLYITGEYATGSIRASMTAVPKRIPVLLAKAGVLASITAVVALVMTFVAFLAGEAVLSSSYHQSVSLSYDGALRAVTGSALYVVCVAVMGLGIGFALRNTGGAIATLFGIVLVLPLLTQALPQSWQDHVSKFLPLNIASHMIETGIHAVDPNQLSYGTGAIMLVIYALAALAIGLAVLKRRDV
ncbi:MAG TPA: ABC transporter permease subunit [Marmoricola sp.]|nr:ABC transporter permease subunit [Marmoricola sp.]